MVGRCSVAVGWAHVGVCVEFNRDRWGRTCPGAAAADNDTVDSVVADSEAERKTKSVGSGPV